MRVVVMSSVLLSPLLAGCSKDASNAVGPALQPSQALAERNGPNEESDDGSLAREVRTLAAAHGIGPLEAPPRVRPELVRLGQALVFDPLLSGNRNIACSTCHLPAFATTDGRSLGIGTGGSGLGPERTLGTGFVIARHAPPAFNLSALRTIFWDGRVMADAAGHLHSPAGIQLTPAMLKTFELGPASAQGMFPVTARPEMRGFQPSAQNELASIDDADFTGMWRALMARLGKVPEYRRLFEAAYPGTRFDEMTFAHASNAMAGFFVANLSFDDSPWDRFLAGRDEALDRVALRGAKTFMTVGCASCHNGPMLTDGQFHNVALAQFGPGKGNGASGRDDFGRMNITGNPADRCAFRTTPLRNVELVGPYGHAGQFVDLRSFVEHYSDADAKLLQYDVRQLDASLQGTLLHNATDILATRDRLLDGMRLTPQQIDDVTAYLRALTDPKARRLGHLTPGRVPSGLPVDGRGM
jgi:cytochrome c peroxidase